MASVSPLLSDERKQHLKGQLSAVAVVKRQLSAVAVVSSSEPLTKQRLFRRTTKEINRFSILPLWGREGIIMWLCIKARVVFSFYLIYALASIVYIRYIDDIRVVLEIKATPYIIIPMQLLAVFLTGLTVNSAALRFKAAFSDVIELQSDTEDFRTCLLASTQDPKIRVSVQIFLIWMMVLLRKQIVSSTDNYNRPLLNLLDTLNSRKKRPKEDLTQCVLFSAEALWAFEGAHFTFVMRHFLSAAQLMHKESHLDALLTKMMASWGAIESLLQVRAPATTFWITVFLVHTWLLSVPLFGDRLSKLMLPVIASIFHTVLVLAEEISDPWEGEAYHNLPLDHVMESVAAPAWEDHFSEDVVYEVILWLNKGLETGVWESADTEYPVPRIVKSGPSKGKEVTFGETLTLHDIAGFATWELFMSKTNNDLEGAIRRGTNRLAPYIKEEVRKAKERHGERA